MGPRLRAQATLQAFLRLWDLGSHTPRAMCLTSPPSQMRTAQVKCMKDSNEDVRTAVAEAWMTGQWVCVCVSLSLSLSVVVASVVFAGSR